MCILDLVVLVFLCFVLHSSLVLRQANGVLFVLVFLLATRSVAVLDIFAGPLDVSILNVTPPM